ncbi:MAG: sensor histidine kinase [Collinsella sp.]
MKHAQRETEPLSIRVRAFETDDGLEIIVEDDGIGMSEEVCAHLFEQHRRRGPRALPPTAPSSEVAAWRSSTCFSASISLRRRFWHAREVPGGRGNAGHR